MLLYITFEQNTLPLVCGGRESRFSGSRLWILGRWLKKIRTARYENFLVRHLRGFFSGASSHSVQSVGGTAFRCTLASAHFGKFACPTTGVAVEGGLIPEDRDSQTLFSRGKHQANVFDPKLHLASSYWVYEAFIGPEDQCSRCQLYKYNPLHTHDTLIKGHIGRWRLRIISADLQLKEFP